MMIRRFDEKDFEEVAFLYKKCLNYNMTKVLYSYMYYNIDKGNYCSFVVEYDGKIVGHNAIIENTYYINKTKILVGLSSGGFVDVKYEGIFFKILKKNISSFSGNLLIAFPNKNSEPFFTKLLSFNSIENYHTLTKDKIKILTNASIDNYSSFVMRTETFINKRINNHPLNKYTKIVKGKTIVIVKPFQNNSIDIIYYNSINNDFKEILIKLLSRYEQINIITKSSSQIESLGFEKSHNNLFVYKYLNKGYNNLEFECQMIDSDVF